MIDSGASSNVMLVLICKKLNVVWESWPMQTVQQDTSKLKVLGELKYVLLTLSIDPIIHQTVDIIVANAP